jgi:hypothetical protein
MSYRTIAKEAGVSLGTVAADAKAGADVSSAETYLRWRRKHRESRASRPREKPATAKPERKAMPSRAPATGGDTWADRVERARRTEKETHSSYLDALARGDTAQLERLLSSHSRAVDQVSKIERLALEAERESGEMLRRSEALATMVAVLTPLREALLKLPLNERTNCNSSQPEIAERALTEWRDRFFVRMNSAENAFKPMSHNVPPCETTM